MQKINFLPKLSIIPVTPGIDQRSYPHTFLIMMIPCLAFEVISECVSGSGIEARQDPKTYKDIID